MLLIGIVTKPSMSGGGKFERTTLSSGGVAREVLGGEGSSPGRSVAEVEGGLFSAEHCQNECPV